MVNHEDRQKRIYNAPNCKSEIGWSDADFPLVGDCGKVKALGVERGGENVDNNGADVRQNVDELEPLNFFWYYDGVFLIFNRSLILVIVISIIFCFHFSDLKIILKILLKTN